MFGGKKVSEVAPPTPKKSFVKEHSLSIVMVSIFIVMSLAVLVLGRAVWTADELAHGGQMLESDFWIWWLFEYQNSIVADVFGAIFLVVLSKYFWEKGSAESKK